MNNSNNSFLRLRNKNRQQNNKDQEINEYPQSLLLNLKQAGLEQVDLLSEEGKNKNLIKNKVQELTNKDVIDLKFVPFFGKSVLVKNIVYKNWKGGIIWNISQML